MKYPEFLVSIKRTAEEMGTKVNTLIKNYTRQENLIAKTKLQMEAAKTPEKKGRLQGDIDMAEAQLIEMSDAIIDAAKKYNANFESNKLKGNRLKKPAQAAAPVVEPVVESVADPVIPTGGVEPPVADPAEPKVEEPKKSGSALGWFFGVVAAVLLGGAAYNHYQSRN